MTEKKNQRVQSGDSIAMREFSTEADYTEFITCCLWHVVLCHLLVLYNTARWHLTGRRVQLPRERGAEHIREMGNPVSAVTRELGCPSLATSFRHAGLNFQYMAGHKELCRNPPPHHSCIYASPKLSQPKPSSLFRFFSFLLYGRPLNVKWFVRVAKRRYKEITTTPPHSKRRRKKIHIIFQLTSVRAIGTCFAMFRKTEHSNISTTPSSVAAHDQLHTSRQLN